jgi:ADP-heptose:LPS heptosyltransferase
MNPPYMFSKIAFFISRFQVAVCNQVIKWAKSALFSQNLFPRRVLIFRTGSIGDSVCAIPALQSIRSFFPAAQIDVLTRTGGSHLQGVASLIPTSLYDSLIDYSEYSRRHLHALLKQRDYDLIIQLPQVDAPFFALLRDMLFFRSLSRSGWGWRYSQSRAFLKAQNDLGVFDNERDRLGKILVANGVPYKSNKGPWLHPSPADRAYVRQYLVSNNISLSRPMIALVVGAKRPQNRWPISHFGAVVKSLARNFTLLAIGGQEDRSLVEQLKSFGAVVDCCGIFTPIQSAALLSNCVLTISNDTGPMHLSYSVGTPTIALFSNRDLPGKWFPPQRENVVFRATNISCAACLSETCGNNICMQVITPDAVLRTAAELLKKRMLFID